eukprot:CAMPEP_0196574136 /NCGR_PEP_ID=MMETSP1081-20130531/3912_1 /TAXON_ID=36882 /ORGANISM="Pyramimonas amylifera, Strain CCMP720" /LENGTH=90 /DNA_ID=CAMNT_0041892063 /DNA_START=149 /DNA_END=421 /DNA_ORIENTATION=-
MLILFFSELLSMREAVLTVSPKRQYRGFSSPTTEATTGPEWNPTRMLMLPSHGASSSTSVELADFTAPSANIAIRTVCMSTGSMSPPTHM